MIRQRPVELLVPARNVECAMAAVDHGADAVYIGASRFGARASAGNSVEDIARVVEYAHTFRVKVYVTVNTILKDEELPETEKLVWALYRAGHGFAGSRPSAHPFACQHADGQPYTGEGEVPP